MAKGQKKSNKEVRKPKKEAAQAARTRRGPAQERCEDHAGAVIGHGPDPSCRRVGCGDPPCQRASPFARRRGLTARTRFAAAFASY